jgi:protein SCO1
MAGAGASCEIMLAMSRNIFLAAIVLAVVAAAAGGWIAARLATPEAPVHAHILDAPRLLPDVPGIDHAGRPFHRADFEGRWTIAFFGFTHCPDICPATLQVLAGTRRMLEDLPAADQPEVLMISVDPARDSPERLAEYVPFFHPEFRGLNVADQHLPELTRGFGVAYFYSALGEDSYTVDHTASLFLVDPQARLAAVFPTPHTADGIATDMRRILKLEKSR